MNATTGRSLMTLITTILVGVMLIITPVPFFGLAVAATAIALIIAATMDTNWRSRLTMTAIRILILAAMVLAADHWGSRMDDADSPLSLEAGQHRLDDLMAATSFLIAAYDMDNAMVTLERDGMSLRQIAGTIEKQLGCRATIAAQCPSGWTILRGYDNSPTVYLSRE